LSLRIAFDLDGVLADMDSALSRRAEALFGTDSARREPGAEPTPEPPRPWTELTPRRRHRLWRQVVGVENFWETLAEIEPGSVRRLAETAAARRWELVFLTKRPTTAGASSQTQSQRWLVTHGFERPSVYVVQGSRGQIAAALELDVVVDDRVESCCDVLAESHAKALLMWRASDTQRLSAIERVGIGVVRSIDDCLETLARLESDSRIPA
jgi:hypothetical protein